MTQDHKQDWNNYWQGRSAAQTGNAFLGVGVEDNAVLNDFWRDIFSKCPEDTNLVDFACGAGSVLTHAVQLGLPNPSGIDISKNAIDILEQKFPSVSGYVCPVDKTPLPDASFDMVVSQFGFEYAGGRDKIISTAREMARLLRPDGRIVLITHISGGVIERGCVQSLKQIDLITQSGFISAARSAFSSIYNVPSQPSETYKIESAKAMTDLSQSAEPIMSWLRNAAPDYNDFEKFAYHLLESTHKLLANSQKYSSEDCEQWLQSMEVEIAAYQGRMQSMANAAMEESDVEAFFTELQSAHIKTEPPEKLYFKKGSGPGAWILKAEAR